MTNAEAIEFIKRKIQIDVSVLTEEEVQTTIEVLNMAIFALEKQEGKKPIGVKLADGRLGDNGIKSGICPVCGEQVDGNMFGEFCGCCGQALDWSEAYGTD